VDLIIPLSSRAHELYKHIDWLLARNVSARDIIGYIWILLAIGYIWI
jgi:hypothetical protein